MATENKKLKTLLYGGLTPRQEISMLRDAWSLVVAMDGTWRVLATTTITAPPESRKTVNLLRYMGAHGADVYSIVKNDKIGPRYCHHDYVRTLGLLGSKMALDVLEANSQGIIRYIQTPGHTFGSEAFMLEPGQTIKVISKDSVPMIPVAETERLVTVALRSPEENASAFIVQQVMNIDSTYKELLHSGAEMQTTHFPTAEYMMMPCAALSAPAMV